MTSTAGKREVAAAGRWSFLSLYVLPSMVLLVIATWPLITGTETLFLRDVTSSHMGMKLFQAEAMRGGALPMINPYSGGGQPHVGNPNTVALYPDNLLYLLADGHWALNAHFWLHLLLMPFTLFWLCRAWGLGHRASWAGGVTFAVSGYVLSSLNLYNVVATIAWTPALTAAMLAVAAPAGRVRWLWATALVWALLILSGDPVTAALALLVGGSAVLARYGLRHRGWYAVAAGIGFGTLLAAPLVVEFLRILNLSFRGHLGYSEGGGLVGSWHPVGIIEWFLPLAFGRPDLDYWGLAFYSDKLPLFISLSPGILAMALALAGHRAGGRAARWAGLMAVVGLLCSLGSFNPLMRLLADLPGADLLRLPIKLWLLVAIGGSVLAAIGAEKVLADGRTGFLRRPLLLLGGLVAVGWLVLNLAPEPVEAQLAQWIPAHFDAGSSAAERVRWSTKAFLVLVTSAALLLVLRLGRSRPVVMMAMLVAVHAATQLFFLRPLLESDDVAAYKAPSPVEALVPRGARVVHGTSGGLFEPGSIEVSDFPTRSTRWLQRMQVRDLYPSVGMTRGRYYDYAQSPEGLDSFLAEAVVHFLETMNDRDRIRVLAASGVEFLILERELAATVAESERLELVGRYETMGRPRHVYRLTRTAAPAQFVGTLHSSEHLNGALETILDPEFDFLSEVVIAGRVTPGAGRSGTVVSLLDEPERMRWKVASEGAGALLVQRSHLPLYRAFVDGEEVPVYAANLSRMAIRLDAGLHTVELRVDRSRFHLGLVLTIVALVALGLLSRGRRAALWLGWGDPQDMEIVGR